MRGPGRCEVAVARKAVLSEPSPSSTARPAVAQCRALPSLRLDLLEGQLDVGMHLRADVEQGRRRGVDRRAGGFLQGGNVSHAWFSFQCRAMSIRLANHTSGNDLA